MEKCQPTSSTQVISMLLATYFYPADSGDLYTKIIKYLFSPIEGPRSHFLPSSESLLVADSATVPQQILIIWQKGGKYFLGLYPSQTSITSMGLQRPAHCNSYPKPNARGGCGGRCAGSRRAETLWWGSTTFWLLMTEAVLCCSHQLLSLQRLLKFPSLSRTKVKAHLAVIIPVVRVSSNHMFYG